LIDPTEDLRPLKRGLSISASTRHDPAMTASPPPNAPSLEALLQELRASLPELRRRYTVASLAVFGSRARGDPRGDSDLDLLVEFDGPVSLLDYAALRNDLEERLGIPVELANRRLLKPAFAQQILREAVPV
jgi:predicted nucleotidyltransferase